jgi:hypothetical protein
MSTAGENHTPATVPLLVIALTKLDRLEVLQSDSDCLQTLLTLLHDIERVVAGALRSRRREPQP